MLRIGVELPCQVDDAGEYLADARAVEAAGADSIWIGRAAAGSEHDPWVLLGGIAAVTHQVRLAIPFTTADTSHPETLVRRLATLHRLSRGRTIVSIDRAETATEDLHAAAGRLGLVPVLLTAGDDAGRRADGVGELWARVRSPDTRQAWRATRHAWTEAGASGVVVPFGPRLLDLLRRPDEEDDRSDLLVAQG